MSAGVETNECLENNGGCWENKNANITACKVRNSSLHRKYLFEDYISPDLAICLNCRELLGDPHHKSPFGSLYANSTFHRIHFEAGFVSVRWYMVCNFRVMVTLLVKVTYTQLLNLVIVWLDSISFT